MCVIFAKYVKEVMKNGQDLVDQTQKGVQNPWPNLMLGVFVLAETPTWDLRSAKSNLKPRIQSNPSEWILEPWPNLIGIGP